MNPINLAKKLSSFDTKWDPKIIGELNGQHVKAQNVNVYIAHAGTCVDVHASRFPFKEGADAELALIVYSASVERLE